MMNTHNNDNKLIHAADIFDDMRRVIQSMYPKIIDNNNDDHAFVRIDEHYRTSTSPQSPSQSQSQSSSSSSKQCMSFLHTHSFYGDRDSVVSKRSSLTNGVGQLSQMLLSHTKLYHASTSDVFNSYATTLKETSKVYHRRKVGLDLIRRVHTALNSIVDDDDDDEYYHAAAAANDGGGSVTRSNHVVSALRSVASSLNFEIEDDEDSGKVEIFSTGQKSCFQMDVHLSANGVHDVKLNFLVGDEEVQNEEINEEVLNLVRTKKYHTLERKFRKLKSMEEIVDANEEHSFELSNGRVTEVMRNLVSLQPSVYAYRMMCEGPRLYYGADDSKHAATFVGVETSWRLDGHIDRHNLQSEFDVPGFVYLFELDTPLVVPASRVISMCFGEVRADISTSEHNTTEWKYNASYLHGLTLNRDAVAAYTHDTHENIVVSRLGIAADTSYTFRICMDQDVCARGCAVLHVPVPSLKLIPSVMRTFRAYRVYNELVTSCVVKVNTKGVVANESHPNSTFDVAFDVDNFAIRVSGKHFSAHIHVCIDESSDTCAKWENMVAVRLLYAEHAVASTQAGRCTDKYATTILAMSRSVLMMVHYVTKAAL